MQRTNSQRICTNIGLCVRSQEIRTKNALRTQHRKVTFAKYNKIHLHRHKGTLVATLGPSAVLTEAATGSGRTPGQLAGGRRCGGLVSRARRCGSCLKAWPDRLDETIPLHQSWRLV